MENHRIIISSELASDYSRTNTKSYNRGQHKEASAPPPEPDPDKDDKCADIAKDLTKCITEVYVDSMRRDEEAGIPTDPEKDTTDEIAKCKDYIKQYQACLKTL